MDQKLVVDCSRSGRPDTELIEKLFMEAAVAASEGQMDRAANIANQAKSLRDKVAEGPVETYVPLTMEEQTQRLADAAATMEMHWVWFRLDRDSRLKACDWTQMPDCGLSQAAVEAWQRYRQILRDLPSRTKDPRDPVWPNPPS